MQDTRIAANQPDARLRERGQRFAPRPRGLHLPGCFLNMPRGTGWTWIVRTVQPMALLIVCATTAVAVAETPPTYEAHIGPLLTRYCAGCHNEDDAEGGLALDSFASLQEGGDHGPAIVPGQAESSRLIRLLEATSEQRMPPEGNEAPTADELALLSAWINAGAKGPQGMEPDRKRLLTPKIVPRHQQPAGITSVTAAPDGNTIAIARFGRVEVRAVGEERLLHTFTDFPGKVNAVHFSADGRTLVTASGISGLSGQACLWDLETGRALLRIDAHRDTMFDAELSPDGQVVATCSYDKRIMLWDRESGKRLRSLEGHNDAVYDLAFSPDGSVLASASGDETVKLWHVGSGERLDTLGQPQAEQYAVAFSPDGKFVLAGGADNRIRVWQFVSRQTQRINPLVYARFAHEGAVIGLAFSPDGSRLVSTAEDRSLKMWDTSDYSQAFSFERQVDVVGGLTWLAGEPRILVGRLDGTRQVYSLPAAAPRQPVAPETMVNRFADMPETAPEQIAELEPNDRVAAAQPVSLPAVIQGLIQPHQAGRSEDQDLFRFHAEQGQQWVLEVNAARQKSPLDSRIEVLDERGQPIERVLLQAVRDSYFTFRGQNSSTSDGFRLHNWEEMELNQYLYASGEVVKLWHYPRGPDSGFMLYPGRGNRYTYFDTTPAAHPLQSPCYIVEPRVPGTPLIPNGLPVFPVYFENDDDGERELGTDSRLTFTVPSTGTYIARITDTRGFVGSDFAYDLTIRPRRPDFAVTVAGGNLTVNAESAKEFTLNVDRIDGFDGEIRVEIDGLPPGFHATSPLVIEAGQNQALGTVFAAADAMEPAAEAAQASKLTATATVFGRQVSKPAGTLGTIKLAPKPKLLVRIGPDPDSGQSLASVDEPVELTIAPGETITAKVVVERNGFTGRVSFGNADAGRNLPHGVYVDNIGLNGLLIVEGRDERTFFLSAAEWVRETTRPFHLLARADGNQATLPVILHVRRKSPGADQE